MNTKKVLYTTKDGLYDIVLITPDILEEVLQFCGDHFFTDEALCRGLEVGKNPVVAADFAKFITIVCEDELSTALIEKSTNKFVTVMCLKMMIKNKSKNQSYFGAFAEKHCTDEFSKSIFVFLDEICTKVNAYELFNVDKIVEGVCLVTHPNYRRQQLGIKIGEFMAGMVLKRNSITSKTMDNILDNKNNWAFLTLCTSQYSKRIANSVGCINIAAMEFSTFKNGQFAEKLPKSHKIEVVGCKLQNIFNQHMFSVQSRI